MRAENTALAASKDTEESGESERKREKERQADRDGGVDEEAGKEEEKKRRRWSGERGSPLSGPPAARGPRQPFTKNCNWKYFSSFFPEIIYESSTGQLARAARLPDSFSLSLSVSPSPLCLTLFHSRSLALSISVEAREDYGQGRNHSVRETSEREPNRDSRRITNSLLSEPSHASVNPQK